MKCVLISENIKRALSFVERSTGKDLTLPILSSVLIQVDGGSIKIMGTNLEIGTESTIRGTVQDQGKVAIPARALSSFIATIPKDEKITFESQKNDLIIQTQSQKTIIKGYPHEDFPPFPLIKELYRISFKKADLLPILQKSLICVSKNSIKPELASVSISFEKDIGYIAATDSFRLSEEHIKPTLLSPKIAKESILIPARTCEELIKLLESENSDTVDLFISKGEILIQYAETRLYSRLTEGKFPDYQQIIPKSFKTTISVNRSVFVNHLKQASIFSNKLSGVSFTFSSGKQEITIESSNRDIGEYKASFKSVIQGEDLTVVFNYHYLMDGLNAFSVEDLYFGFNNESQPLLIYPTKKSDSLYLVMPMKGGV